MDQRLALPNGARAKEASYPVGSFRFYPEGTDPIRRHQDPRHQSATSKDVVRQLQRDWGRRFPVTVIAGTASDFPNMILQQQLNIAPDLRATYVHEVEDSQVGDRKYRWHIARISPV